MLNVEEQPVININNAVTTEILKPGVTTVTSAQSAVTTEIA